MDKLQIFYMVTKLLTLAVVAYWLRYDAKGRDFHPVIWPATAVLLGLFSPGIVGPILLAVTMIVYLWRRPKGAMRLCPHCKKPVLAMLANCPFCNGVLKKDCYRCFTVVDVTQERCPNCHAKLS